MPIEVRLAYLPAPILNGLAAAALFVLCVAATLHWNRSRRGYLALFAGAALLVGMAFLLGQIEAFALQGKSVEEMIKVARTPRFERLANVGVGLGLSALPPRWAPACGFSSSPVDGAHDGGDDMDPPVSLSPRPFRPVPAGRTAGGARTSIQNIAFLSEVHHNGISAGVSKGAGASVDLRDKEGHTVLDLARDYQRFGNQRAQDKARAQLSALLLKHGAKPGEGKKK